MILTEKWAWVAVIGLLLVGGCGGTEAPSCASECVSIGRCTLQGDVCVAAGNDDCKRSMLCWVDGLCEAKAGDCKASQAGCKASYHCKTMGLCSVVSSGSWYPDYCAAKGNDCKASEVCIKYGACTVSMGACYPDT